MTERDFEAELHEAAFWLRPSYNRDIEAAAALCLDASLELHRILAERDSLRTERDGLRNAQVVFRIAAEKDKADLDEAREQLTQAREALEFYANEDNHHWQQMEYEDGERYTKASSLVDEDFGKRARQALATMINREGETEA